MISFFLYFVSKQKKRHLPVAFRRFMITRSKITMEPKIHLVHVSRQFEFSIVKSLVNRSEDVAHHDAAD